MDPITAGLGIIGMGMQIFGGIGASNDAHKAAEISKAKYLDEQQLNFNRQLAMEVSARRQNMEILRNSQRARSMALQAATNQGAQFGSGLQGGYGQIAGNVNNNLLSNSQSLQSGRQTYGINNDISALNLQMADVQSSQATHQGIAQLGSSIGSVSGTLGKMSQGISFGDPLGGFGGSSKWGIGFGG